MATTTAPEKMPDGRSLLRLALPASRPLPPPELSAAESANYQTEAERLGVLPAVSQNLGVNLPCLRRVAARNLWLKQEQARLLDVLSQAGVMAHAVKGVALAEHLYPDLSWREIEDIDLLVDKQQAARAVAVLRSAGLIPNHDWTSAGLARLLARSESLAPELVFTTADGLLVELHWDWPGERLPAGDLFDQPESYLLYLCRHAGKHFWSRLKWTCDIELFRRRYDDRLNWALFWRIARETGNERTCAVALELCRRWFEAPLAPGLHERLDRKTRRLADSVSARLLNPFAPPAHPIWLRLRLAAWRHRPSMVREWLSPQPQEWNAGENRGWSARQVWLGRVRRLWSRWAPHRTLQLSAADWGLLLEAYFTVAALETVRRLVSFQRLLRWAEPNSPSQPATGWTYEKLRRVAWLVDVAANRQPVAIRCLTRSLALARMLKRRGVAVELRIGVKQQDAQTQAHAWLEWQGEVLHDPMHQAEGYVALAGASS